MITCGMDYQWLRVGGIISDYVWDGLSVITCGMDYQWLRVGWIISDYVWDGLSVITCWREILWTRTVPDIIYILPPSSHIHHEQNKYFAFSIDLNIFLSLYKNN
jgi:hypothetical protein